MQNGVKMNTTSKNRADSRYNLVAENPQSTVVAEYIPVYRTARALMFARMPTPIP